MSARLGLKVPRGSAVLGVSRVEEMNTEVRRLSKAVARPTWLPLTHRRSRAKAG